MYGNLETSYKKSVLRGEGLPLFLDMTSSESRTPSSSNSPVSGPSLGHVSVTVARCSEECVERVLLRASLRHPRERKTDSLHSLSLFNL